ncbi:MAG: hypothetical protein EHM77_05325 [Planctomycetaceae bacterium]|nr:MAG: hypothetical protein EHM77_05325 [Planctomycetaceae bacterium]
MNSYQNEQLETLTMIRQHLDALGAAEISKLKIGIEDYLLFRDQVTHFLENHFTAICIQKCYQNRLSACCTKDGIITFFADMVINALVSDNADLDRLEHAIRQPADSAKCIYLSETGCGWNIKPVVCEFFLCDEAEKKAFNGNPDALQQWKKFKNAKQTYTWPDKIVLFEILERYFMDMGCKSPLMYLHYSPGLVRIRKGRHTEVSHSGF